jgi:hypothetical protein
MPGNDDGRPGQGGHHQETPGERSDLTILRGSTAEMALTIVAEVQRRHQVGQRARFAVDPAILPALLMEVADLAALAAHLYDLAQPGVMPLVEQLRHLGDEAA